MGLAQRAVRGMMWAYLVFFAGKLVTLIVTTILARLLGVADFGLWGVALLVITYVEATQDFGINAALIYNTEKEKETAVTAFWLNLLVGVLQFALIFAVAPLARFIPSEGGVVDSSIVNVVRVIGFIFVINALGNTHDGLLQKELQFRKRYMPDFWSAVIKGVASVILALVLQNVWALVYGQLIGAVVRTVSRWWLLPTFRPTFQFYPERARALWDYGKYIVIDNMFTVVLDQADQSAIAVLIGVIQIGYYTIAARVPEMVIANFSIILTRVLFPVFAKMKQNMQQLTQAFLTTTQYTAFFTVPMGLGMAAIAPELMLIFGEKWLPAIGLLQALSILQMAYTLPWSAGDMLKAAGRLEIQTRLLYVEAAYTLPLIIFASMYTREAFWASSANALAALITAVLRLYVASRFLQFSPLRYVRVFRTPFIGGALMVAAVQGVRWLTSPMPALVMSSRPDVQLNMHTPMLPLPFYVTLLLSIGVGAAVYASVLLLMEGKTLKAGAALVRDALQKGDDDDDDEPETPSTALA